MPQYVSKDSLADSEHCCSFSDWNKENGPYFSCLSLPTLAAGEVQNLKWSFSAARSLIARHQLTLLNLALYFGLFSALSAHQKTAQPKCRSTGSPENRKKYSGIVPCFMEPARNSNPQGRNPLSISEWTENLPFWWGLSLGMAQKISSVYPNLGIEVFFFCKSTNQSWVTFHDKPFLHQILAKLMESDFSMWQFREYYSVIISGSRFLQVVADFIRELTSSTGWEKNIFF